MQIDQCVEPAINLEEMCRLSPGNHFFKEWNVFPPCLRQFDLNVSPLRDHSDCIGIGQRFLLRGILENREKLVVMLSHLSAYWS